LAFFEWYHHFLTSFSPFKILVVAGDGSVDWDLGDNLPESIDKISFRLASFGAILIEEIVPIISLASDRSGFDFFKSYEGISGTG
jgi:hypothetical protein